MVVFPGMGFVVMGVAGSIGDYGGAQMNPAVTVAMTICARITITRGWSWQIFIKFSLGLNHEHNRR